MVRHLTKDNVENALGRGKTVEVFLGRCERDGQRGIRYLTVCLIDDKLEMRLYEREDCGDPNFLDLYEFGPLNPETVYGDPDLVKVFPSLEACLSEIEKCWPGGAGRIVNEGVLQDEYSDFLAECARP